MKSTAPRPWRVDPESNGRHWTDSVSIMDAEGGEVCVLTRGYQSEHGDGCPSWDNAEMIVAAVNAYVMSYTASDGSLWVPDGSNWRRVMDATRTDAPSATVGK